MCFIMGIFLKAIMLSILFCSVENSFSAEGTERKDRPTWKNEAIEGRLRTIWNGFYQGKQSPEFLQTFKSRVRTSKTNANNYLNEFVSQLHITTSIDNIEKIFKEFDIIVLRPPTKEKLILSCGNYITDSECRFYKSHCGKDFHPDADTVDVNIGMNPNIVADLSTSHFYDYLMSLNKTYNEIVAEGGYTLHGSSGLKKLRKILNVNGIYKLEMGTIFTVVNAGKLKDFKGSLESDQYFSLLLPQQKYQELSSMNPQNVANILREEMSKFYEQNGFTLQIKHPESFTLSVINSGKDPEVSIEYSIGRNEVEAANITLTRVK